MTMTSSLFGVLLALLSPGQPAPTPGHPIPTDSRAPILAEAAAAAPACSIALLGDDRKVKAIVTAAGTGFEGRAHLQLAGQGFSHDDLRPVRIAAGARLVLPVPSVPMPKRLSGELTLLDVRGDTVCVARL